MGAIFRKLPLGVKVVDEKCVSSSDSIFVVNSWLDRPCSWVMVSISFTLHEKESQHQIL